MNWLSTELGKKGVVVWVDEGEIHVGDSLIRRIQEGISKTRFFAAVLSKSSVKSQWVKKELEMAITREVEERKIVVLPLVIEDCEIPLYIETKTLCRFQEVGQRWLGRFAGGGDWKEPFPMHVV